MSNINTIKAKTLGSIGAVQTLVEKFGMLFSIDTFDPGTTSFSFMFNILDMLGVTKEEIIEWLAKLLAGKGSDGVLEAIEQVVKAILLANVRNILTCTMNPLLPDKLMYKYKDVYGNTVGGTGIEIDLDAVDLYGILNNCPTGGEGSVFYFDAKKSIYSTDEHYVEGYSTSSLWKSCDFNAFLWYVINKGSNTGAEARKLYWDNRVNYIKTFTANESLKNDFFNGTSLDGKFSVKGRKVKKKQIVICEYVERSHSKVAPNVLRIWLNDERYYNTRKIKIGSIKAGNTVVRPAKSIALSKTVFEFNYDYIYSLKLFETKTLVAAIVNAILGISASINPKLSIYHEFIAGKISTVVKRIIESDDTTATELADCFYTFSNDEYDTLLQESIKKHNGTFHVNGFDTSVDYSSVLDSLNNIDDSATLQEQINQVGDVFNRVLDLKTAEVQLPYENVGVKFDWGLSILYEILEQTVTQIVMQVLSPKVAILFQVNQYIMGDIDPESDVWNCGWENFLKNFQNVIIQTIKQIKEIILQKLLAWVLEKIAPLLALFVSKLLLETINNYITLLKQLISLCGLAFGSGSRYAGGLYVNDVDYADIIPSQIAPNNGDCG